MNKLNFSYASKLEHNFDQRLIIKTIENVTGKRKLEKLYRDYSENAGDPVYFWRDILKLMDIKINNAIVLWPLLSAILRSCGFGFVFILFVL